MANILHPFLDLVSGRSSNWHSTHARVGGVRDNILRVRGLERAYGKAGNGSGMETGNGKK